MLNNKKLEMAYKAYSNNYIDGIKLDDVQRKYDSSKSKTNHIVERNDTEKDHILLINLNRILSYYLSQWKTEVLINGGNKTEALKIMQMAVFYQCMGQELYKTKYPQMALEYSFKSVITALVHFTMFGWEKEESVLFDFIAEHLDDHLMQVNDENKHIWFLLELYVQYRNKTVMDANHNLHLAVKEALTEEGQPCGLIPEDLDIYSKVLEQWQTPDSEEIESLITGMSVHHSALASEIGQLGEFGDFRYGFYPFEILFLIFVRRKLGLPVPEHYNGQLMNTPEAKMELSDTEPYPEWDPVLRSIDNFYRKNYPGYIPNKHGELFQ
jgi:hypothetical protein